MNYIDRKKSTISPCPILLIIESEELWLKTLLMVFEPCHWNILYARDEKEAFEILSTIRPDTILMDYVLCGTMGDVLTRQIKSNPDYSHIPICVLTFTIDRSVQSDVLRSGADSFIANPIDSTILISKISVLIKRGQIHKILERFKDTINNTQIDKVDMLCSKFSQIHDVSHMSILNIIKHADHINPDSKDHLNSVKNLCTKIARSLDLPEKLAGNIGEGACLKDIGNAFIPKQIFVKTGGLNSDERQIIQNHTLVGNHILGSSISEVVQLGASIALNHHEWWNGKGYPQGLRRTEIPIEARITAVADVYTALCSNRPYRKAFTLNEAVQIIKKGSGNQFESKVVTAFESVVD